MPVQGILLNHEEQTFKNCTFCKALFHYPIQCEHSLRFVRNWQDYFFLLLCTFSLAKALSLGQKSRCRNWHKFTTVFQESFKPFNKKIANISRTHCLSKNTDCDHYMHLKTKLCVDSFESMFLNNLFAIFTTEHPMEITSLEDPVMPDRFCKNVLPWQHGQSDYAMLKSAIQ